MLLAFRFANMLLAKIHYIPNITLIGMSLWKSILVQCLQYICPLQHIDGQENCHLRDQIYKVLTILCFTQCNTVSWRRELALRCHWFAHLRPSLCTDSTSSICSYLGKVVVTSPYRKMRIVLEFDNVDLHDWNPLLPALLLKVLKFLPSLRCTADHIGNPLQQHQTLDNIFFNI